MGARVRQFADPTVILSVVLLLLNDRVLKGQGPAWLTGKLSDFAGVYLVAMIVGIVFARPDVAVATTAVGFVAIKVSYGAAQLAAPVLGGVTRQDHADLIALLALVPAWLMLRRSRSPLGSGSFGSLLAATTLLFAGASVTATSCDIPNAVDAITVDPAGALVARINVASYGGPPADPLWARSVDGGVNWASISDPGLQLAPTQQVCDGAGQCFRVISGLRVEQVDADGGWHTAFTFTSEQRRRMRARANMCEDTNDGFRSLIVVDEQPHPQVVVAMGGQGVLIRASDGQWQRRAVLDRRPLSLWGPSWLDEARFVPILGLLLSPAVYRIARRRGGRPRALQIANQAAIVQAALVAVAMGVVFFVIDYAITGPIILVATVIALVISLVRAITARPLPALPDSRPPQPPPPPPPALHREALGDGAAS